MHRVVLTVISILVLGSPAAAVILPPPTSPIQIKCNAAAEGFYQNCVNGIGVADEDCDSQAEAFYFNCVRGNTGIE